MLDETELPERGCAPQLFLPAIRQLLRQPIRTGVCLHSGERSGNCDQQSCRLCSYFLAEREGQ